MKEVYHICLSSHDEVLFRSPEDHYAFINLSGIEVYRAEAELLVSAEMSTHWHQGIFSAQPIKYAAGLRMSYTHYFNRKYSRKGKIGENKIFLSKVSGFFHHLVLFNYILRNGLHHGVATTPFGYEYCSSRELFKKELGYYSPPPVYTSRKEMAQFFPRHAEFPDHYALDRNGMLIRERFMELRRVEQYYQTPRNYLFQMNRLTDESWSVEQKRDRTGDPLTLADVERVDENGIVSLLKNEKGKTAGRGLDDLDVCQLIERDYLSGSGGSVYQISRGRKKQIAKSLFYDYHIPERQIRRCLVLRD